MHAVSLERGPCWCPVCEWPDQKVFCLTAAGKEYLKRLDAVPDGGQSETDGAACGGGGGK